jgi:hypothetical protein
MTITKRPSTSLLTKVQIDEERLRTMADTFSKADTTMLGKDITVSVVNVPGVRAPAYSTGGDIYLNTAYIGGMDSTDDIIKVTGLNWHELGHEAFTPRNTWFTTQLRRMGLYQHFNMLEDQRIESLLAAMYPSMKPYFTMTVMKFIASRPDQLGTAHGLTYGRKYLPDRVRAALRARFQDQSILCELEAIIDDYRMVVFPTDEQKALMLVERFRNLLVNALGPNDIVDPHGHSTDTRPDPVVNQPPDKSKQEQGRERIKQGDDEADDDDQYDDVDDKNDTDDSDVDTDTDASDDGDDDGDLSYTDDDDAGDDTGDEDGDDAGGTDDGDDDTDADDAAGDGDSDDDFDDADDAEGDGDAETDADGEGEDGEGGTDSDTDGESEDSDGGTDGGTDGQDGDTDADNTGADDSGTDSSSSGGDNDPLLDDADLSDMLDNIADAAANRQDVMDDALNKQRAIERLSGRVPELRQESFYLDTPDPTYVAASNRFKRELQRLWADVDPGWKRERPAGRLNVQRVLRGDDLDTVFDEWNEGKQDAASLEVILVVDNSWSMGRLGMDAASQSVWAVKRAVESIGGEVTVIGFSDEATTMYPKGEKALRATFRRFGPVGSTSCDPAIDAARMIMHYSNKVHRIVLFMTDGAWDDGFSAEKSIQVLHQHGIMTALAHISNIPTLEPDDHGCQSAHVIEDPSGLVDLAKKIVKQAMLA